MKSILSLLFFFSIGFSVDTLFYDDFNTADTSNPENWVTNWNGAKEWLYTWGDFWQPQGTRLVQNGEKCVKQSGYYYQTTGWRRYPDWPGSFYPGIVTNRAFNFFRDGPLSITVNPKAVGGTFHMYIKQDSGPDGGLWAELEVGFTVKYNSETNKVSLHIEAVPEGVSDGNQMLEYTVSTMPSQIGLVLDSLNYTLLVNGVVPGVAGATGLHGLTPDQFIKDDGAHIMFMIQEPGVHGDPVWPEAQRSMKLDNFLVVSNAVINGPPKITVLSPQNGLVTPDSAVLLSGKVNDETVNIVFVDGVSVPVTNKNFSVAVGLAVGSNLITLTATNSFGSGTTKFVMIRAGSVAPSAPQGLSGSKFYNSVNLSWRDNPEADLMGYNIYRSPNQAGPFEKIYDNRKNNNYTDESLTENTAYYYQITAYNAGAQESSPSAVVAVTTGSAFSFSSNFETRRQNFLSQNSNFWAQIQNSPTSSSVDAGIDTKLSEYDQRYGALDSYRHLMRILRQFGNVINPSKKQLIEAKFAAGGPAGDAFAGQNINQRINTAVAYYLWAQDNTAVTCTYAGAVTWESFTYAGFTYTLGQTYNLFQILTHWLEWKMDQWTWEKAGCEEFDSITYHHVFITAMLALADMATNLKIKRKAQMTLELVLLDAIMDFSVDHWGGAHSRYYVQDMLDEAQKAFFLNSYFGYNISRLLGSDGSDGDIMASPYRVPPIIEQLGEVYTESDFYYHVNMEYNPKINIIGTGKYTYVTPNYNLGGTAQAQWDLNIKGGKPFRVWINASVDEQEFMGMASLQYQHSLFIPQSPVSQLYLHIRNNSFTTQELTDPSGWDFYLRDKVAVAILMKSDHAALEVATLGVDYVTYNDFKTAVISKAALTPHSFINSKGEIIANGSTVNGTVNGLPIWNFPFKRMETAGSQGTLVDFPDPKIMVLRKNGLVRSYDFNKWLFSDTEPTTSLAERLSGTRAGISLAPSPNPFKPFTTLFIHLPQKTAASLGVYDLNGREVTHLFKEAALSGNRQYVWDARQYASGVYLFKLSTPTEVIVTKGILVK